MRYTCRNCPHRHTVLITAEQRVLNAILFDLDDTLLDRAATAREFIRHQYHRFGLAHLPHDVYCSRFIELDANGYVPRPQVFAALCTEFNLPITAETLIDDFATHAWQQCILFADALPVLGMLRERGILLGIITNGSSLSQRAKLRATGLADCLDVILVSGEEGIAKPDTAIFQRAADRLGVDPADCAFVGDNPATDVLGAHQAGMISVWLRGLMAWPESFDWQPDHTISELGGLITILMR